MNRIAPFLPLATRLLVLLLILMAPKLLPAAPSRLPDRAAFSVQFADEVIPYRVFGVYVMPNEQAQLEVLFGRPEGGYNLLATGGQIEVLAPGRWRWRAPAEPGLYPITINDGAGQAIALNAFVMHPLPASKDRIDGFRVGRYPAKPLRGNPRYLPPQGLVRVTAETADVRVAPHFKLGEFMSKQAGGYPKFVALRERLLLKLEMIIEQLNEAGYPASSLHIMSGYRTPYYNKSIGNVAYSRHVWGGAADIFLDEKPRDGRMDDLTGDGKVDIEDARRLYQLVEDVTDETWYRPFVGGLGLYGPKPHRGPFVHVDVRGHKARWSNP